ncbi:spore germination protein [Bacillus salipaludis]|uniref:Spore germination protein n=1 Tax=Bacillus salipaludis TaxID=2547811 RepID=A0ABW8RQW3_9BACI
MKIVERGQTKIAIMYLADVANPEVLQELIDRINKLEIDCLLRNAKTI